MNADCRLVTYGTLAPGRPNHHQLNGLTGRWLPGTVRGQLVEHGWGAAMGYPAFVPDSNGETLQVQVFESIDLPNHWARLDEFEGAEYERVIVPADTSEGKLDASMYVTRR